MSSNSTSKPQPRKAKPYWSIAGLKLKRPYPDFPLSPHARGVWQKKILGSTYYFGRWANWVKGKLVPIEGTGWQEALEQYKAQADDLHAGRKPRERTGDELTMNALCNKFLTAKQRRCEAGEMGRRMLQDYRGVTDLLIESLGGRRIVEDLAAADFEKLRADMAKRWGPTRLKNTITRIRSVFKYGLDNGLIEKPIRYGSEFLAPDKSVMRRHRATRGEKMLEAEQLRELIKAADVPLKAMILLGLNAAYGNHDVATLPMDRVNLETGWATFPRPKTGVARRASLWPETIAAIKDAIATRPAPKSADDAALVFLNSRGLRWVRETTNSRTDTLTVQFDELLTRLGIKKPGMSFYTLRHVHRTISDAARDPVACDLIMGHADPSMGAEYRERIDDDRLRAVTDHVRGWLFGKSATKKARAPRKAKASLRIFSA